jgi:hypothetical protein
VTDRPTHAYCPTCREDSAINGELRCLWCGGETRTARKRGKPKGVWGKLEDRHLRALYAFHVDRGVSIRELGRRVWKQAGFANAHSAGVAISYGFIRLGLKALDRGEATARANSKRRAATSPGTADRKTYKRYLRKKKGGYRICQGVKLGAPRKGSPCTRYASPGSDYCYVHDPARRDEVVAIAADMRARQRLLPAGELEKIEALKSSPCHVRKAGLR